MLSVCEWLYICLLNPAVKLVCEDPVLDNSDKYFLTREEAFDRRMEKSMHYIQLCREHDPIEVLFIKL